MRVRVPVAWLLWCGLTLPAPALADPGVNLAWGNCHWDGGAFNRVFPCHSNTSIHALVGSFESPVTVADPHRVEVVIDLASASPTLPAWWEFRNAGSCRQTSMSLSSVLPAIALSCEDWADALGMPAVLDYVVGARGPNTARILASVTAQLPVDGLVPTREYYAFTLSFNSQKTVGSPSCAGCSTPVCIVFNSLRLGSTATPGLLTLTSPGNGIDSHTVTWQSGIGVSVGSAIGCPAATATTRSTWGSVKATYR